MTTHSHDASYNDASHFNKLDFEGNVHRFSELLMQISEKAGKEINQSLQLIVSNTLLEILEGHSQKLSAFMGLYAEIAVCSDPTRRIIAFEALTYNEELFLHPAEVRKQYCDLLKLFVDDPDLCTQQKVFSVLLRFPERDQAYLEDLARNGSLQTRAALVSAMRSKYALVCKDFSFELDRQVLLAVNLSDAQDLWYDEKLSLWDHIKNMFTREIIYGAVLYLKRSHAELLNTIERELKYAAMEKEHQREVETLVPVIDELISNLQFEQIKTYLVHNNLVVAHKAAQGLAEHGLLKGNPELLFELCASPYAHVVEVALDYWETPTDQSYLSKARRVLEQLLIQNWYRTGLKEKIVERLADTQISSYSDLVRLFSDPRFECVSMSELSQTVVQSFERELAAQAIPQSDLMQILLTSLPIKPTEGLYIESSFTVQIKTAIHKISLKAAAELDKQGAIDRKVALRLIEESKLSSMRVFAVGLLSKYDGGQACLQSILENKESRKEKDIALAAYEQLKKLGVTDVALGERMLALGKGFGEHVSPQIIDSLISDPVGNRKLLKRLARKFPVCAKDVAQAFARKRDKSIKISN